MDGITHITTGATITAITIAAIITDITTMGTIIGIGLGPLGHGGITAIGKRWILCGAEPRVHNFLKSPLSSSVSITLPVPS